MSTGKSHDPSPDMHVVTCACGHTDSGGVGTGVDGGHQAMPGHQQTGQAHHRAPTHSDRGLLSLTASA